MPRRPTVYDVAERAGVSIATVSFAFRQPQRVRESTRDSVLEAAKELGYVPSASARGLARGTTGALGLYSFDLMLGNQDPLPENDLLEAPHISLDPRLFPLYVDEVERGFALECRTLGRALLLDSGAPLSSDVYDIAGRVDGLAVFPGPHRPETLHTVAQSIPVLAFSTVVDDAPFSHVHVDNHAGIDHLLRHLAQTHDVRDAAFVGNLSMHEFQERLASFEALRETYFPESVPTDSSALLAELAGPEWPEALGELIDARHLPRALVCENDQRALEVLDLLIAKGVKVPSDVIVTGFDGILAGRLSNPTLTTVRQPLETMGRLAARLLSEQAATRDRTPTTHILPLQPDFRGSCGCSDH